MRSTISLFFYQSSDSSPIYLQLLPRFSFPLPFIEADYLSNLILISSRREHVILKAMSHDKKECFKNEIKLTFCIFPYTMQVLNIGQQTPTNPVSRSMKWWYQSCNQRSLKSLINLNFKLLLFVSHQQGQMKKEKKGQLFRMSHPEPNSIWRKNPSS